MTDEPLIQRLMAASDTLSRGGAIEAIRIVREYDRRVEIDRWQQNSRETWSAMQAMRNAINEHIPMPSLDSDLLQGPENSVFCAVVSERVVAKCSAQEAETERLTKERDEAWQWRPIETAPKDGTRFWGKVGDDAISMEWHQGFGAFVSEWRRMEMAPGYTIDGQSHREHSPVIHGPTHWMPQPKEPTT